MRDAVGFGALCLTVGAAAAGAWWVLAPVDGPEARAAQDGWFALLALLGGAVLGVVAALPRRAGPGRLGLAVLGSAAAGGVAGVAPWLDGDRGLRSVAAVVLWPATAATAVFAVSLLVAMRPRQVPSGPD